jgi:hypothetical protein
MNQMKLGVFLMLFGLVILLGCGTNGDNNTNTKDGGLSDENTDTDSNGNSDETKTYDLTGYWTFAGIAGICSQSLPPSYGGSSLEFETIAVKVFESDEARTRGEIYKESTTPCSEHEFVIETLAQGSYLVNVVAMAPDPTESTGEDAPGDGEPMLRPYYETTQEVVVPDDVDEPVEFEMKLGTGSIEVSWEFEDGGQCNQNDVATVSIELTGQANGRQEGATHLDCTEHSWRAENLVWDTYDVTVKGFKEGDTENPTHAGAFENPVEIRPGTHITGKDGLVELVRY